MVLLINNFTLPSPKERRKKRSPSLERVVSGPNREKREIPLPPGKGKNCCVPEITTGKGGEAGDQTSFWFLSFLEGGFLQVERTNPTPPPPHGHFAQNPEPNRPSTPEEEDAKRKLSLSLSFPQGWGGRKRKGDFFWVARTVSSSPFPPSLSIYMK